MFELEIPGWGKLSIKNLLLDFNGTLALDGKVDEQALFLCSKVVGKYHLKPYIITAATNPVSKEVIDLIKPELIVIRPGNEAWQKLTVLLELGANETATAGNGANDKLMLSCSALGIAVFDGEGAVPGVLDSADIVVKSTVELFELFVYTKRIIGTLRR